MEKIKCEKHKEEKILAYCKTDKEYLCGMCIQINFLQHRMHKVISIEKLSNSTTKIFSSPNKSKRNSSSPMNSKKS